MIEATGDLFEYPADAVVIPTNWERNGVGHAVMGAGVALEAAKRWPWMPKELGYFIKFVGRKTAVAVFRGGDVFIVAFPTKRRWRRPSTLVLIEQSAQELAYATKDQGWQTVALPRVGCGLGGLRWEDVKPILERHLDDRFVVLTPESHP